MNTERESFMRYCKAAFLGTVPMLVLILFPVLASAAMGISQSKHNLSVTGPGTIKATGESEICVFCHTPHRAESVGILWNRKDPISSYIPYDSTTVQTFIGQPTGASRLCLSCHDGTIALGEVTSRFAEISMSQRFLDSGLSGLSSDLSDDHPISFVYDTALSASNPEYADPTLLIDEVTLDQNSELQCTSCHDPHDNTYGKFLVVDSTFSALCLTCHQPTGWNTSAHKLSSSGWNSVPPDPWPHTDWNTTAENGCDNCHRPHSAGGPPRLLNELVEENNCFPCHNGNVASTDIQSEFTKFSVHPVTSTVGVHEPNEDYLTVSRHVECADCHNPHQVNIIITATAPDVSGRLTGVSGVSESGSLVQSATYQYEICFKCHGDSAQGMAPIPRQITELNKRLQFDLSNPSFHSVEGPGQNPNVPSLLPAYSTASMIYCTDCHNNEAGPGALGTGPSGVHGSQWEYLLERRYETADLTLESVDAYALCYKCHDRNSILGDDSFSEHDKHIRGEDTPCSVCHDPHGISSYQGNVINNSHLMNFDTSIVFMEPTSGKLEFQDNGIFAGECTLVCHGEVHTGAPSYEYP